MPEVVMALREELDVASPFEKAFKASVAALGRVYEPLRIHAGLRFPG